MPEEAAENLELLTFLPFFSQQVNEEMIKKQIDVVGAASLFYRIDQSFKDLKIEPLFIREQWDLYWWRCQFFKEHFPDVFTSTYNRRRTLSFLLCCSFDEVSDLALRSDLRVKARQDKFTDAFIEKLSRHNEQFSIAALVRFHTCRAEDAFEFLNLDLLDHLDLFSSQEDYPLSIDDVTAMVVELYPSQVKHPRSLEEIAMKVVLKHGISMEEMSRDLKKKSVLLLQGKISHEDVDVEGDVYSQNNNNKYNGGGDDMKIKTLSNQEVMGLKKKVNGKGVRLIRKAKFYLDVYF
jgi:hypothetical protein